MKKFKHILSELSVVQKVLVGFVVLIGLSVATQTGHPTSLQTTNSSNKSQSSQSLTTSKAAKAPVITTQTETETQALPFSSATVNSASLAKGTTKITTAGVNGSETLTYKLTFSDGAQTNKELVGTTVTAQPVTQITTVGTYVAPPKPAPAPAPAATACPNGTYVNSAGNTVCSPYASSSAPSGATAKCGDGTYSFSQSRSGTCSHHGGVTTWL